ncbi:ArsR/SmtB family transcription factor [Stutzerimonas frequens]|jgi:ArsR family transcriptional regulator|uniref:Helix-turn-helix transcriptional regulator n=1 Tax=Stutzerimonas frequens TaxID=2968969 RepID=A0AA47DYY5_9GAMM|nr:MULTISPECIES: metalloregulator ArsR/SmtB family transcription factor [Stutzerimonas stutzeri group]MBA4728284.1 helix-turn-helix transcriptional regulator [Pseudomonas sp.]TDL94994.1 transcriptional regulator [Stutzerimonas stutzeri ATCC 17588 = LMG 11199]AWT09822.1 transcriptional regulator [Stutzerimonas frequens]KZX64559.1 transcriptional regulator [Stutzerimonas frequens]MBK3758404.1 metalloregulator ArsR/SmtB family transcription factor [Stutzerimonas frequens]
MTPDLDIDSLKANAASASALLKALANPDRLLLLCQLSQGERSVSELEQLLGIQQPTLSQQLGVLRREGLVATRREGKLIHYRISSPEALAVIATLYQLFCERGQQ